MNEKSVVFVSGAYDLLHKGHIEILKYAKSLGCYLIVAIDSDEKVKKDKGEDRPFFHQEDRKFVLESIKYIDRVVIFNSEEELVKLLSDVKPDIRVAGSDWKGKKIVGEEHCGEVKFFERLEGYSTSSILEYRNGK